MAYISHQNSGKYISLAGIFLGIFAMIIVGAFVYKIIHLALTSPVDINHQYIFGAVAMTNTKEVIVVDQNPHILSALTFNTNNTVKNVATSLSVPVDYFLDRQINSNNPIQDELAKVILYEKSISFFDKIKLWWDIKSVAPRDIQIQSLKFPIDPTADDKTLNTIFLDNDIYQENKNISVVNATGISGVATIVSDYLTRIGAHVISVTTADNVQDTSTITYSGKKGYTVARIERMLQTRAIPQQQKDAISDIIVTIGKDKAHRF